MKPITRLFSLALIFVLLLTQLTGVSFATAADGGIVSQTVTKGDISVEIFRYTPEDFNFRGNDTPLLFVLGDVPFTAQSAAQTLNTKGFKEIADEESCSVVFVSPQNGETWSQEDYLAMQTLAGNATDIYFHYETYAGGVSEEGYFYASRTRQYTFAEGSAVKFVQQYLDVEGAGFVNTEWTALIDHFGAGFIYAEDGFTSADVSAAWNEARNTTLLYSNDAVTYYAPYYYWDEQGVQESRVTMQTEYEDIPTLEYYFYVPNTVDLKSETEKYPLVLLFHGNGLHPQVIAQNTAWPMVGKQEKFVVVSVNGLYGTQHDGEVITQLIDTLTAQYAIDPTRVYVSGYSKGAGESAKLAWLLPEKIAGVGVFEAVYGMQAAYGDYEYKYTMPYYSVEGQLDFYHPFPKDTERAAQVLAKIGLSNGFAYTYDEEIGGFWGYDFDLDETIRVPEERTALNIHSIRSEKDGTVYTKLVDAYNLGHNVVRSSTVDMWDFLSQFSRNADGSLNVEEHHTFTDVSKDQWYYYPVQTAAKNHLLVGTSATTFAPQMTTSRAMLVTALWRFAGKPEAGTGAQFSDVSQDAWYAQAVNWAKSNGVVYGVTDAAFAPDAPVTREQAVAILYRYARLIGLDTSAQADLASFDDAGSVSAYAQTAIRWAVASGLVYGSQNGGNLQLLPKQTATRAETAAFLVRFGVFVGNNGIQ